MLFLSTQGEPVHDQRTSVGRHEKKKEFTYSIFSRGEIVHLPSLIKALEEKKMWGVALDVFEGEKK